MYTYTNNQQTEYKKKKPTHVWHFNWYKRNFIIILNAFLLFTNIHRHYYVCLLKENRFLAQTYPFPYLCVVGTQQKKKPSYFKVIDIYSIYYSPNSLCLASSVCVCDQRVLYASTFAFHCAFISVLRITNSIKMSEKYLANSIHFFVSTTYTFLNPYLFRIQNGHNKNINYFDDYYFIFINELVLHIADAYETSFLWRDYPHLGFK